MNKFPQCLDSASTKHIETLLELSHSPIVEVLVQRDGGGSPSRYVVHRERLLVEFIKGLMTHRENSACPSDPVVCTCGAIRYSGLKYLVDELNRSRTGIAGTELFPVPIEHPIFGALKGRSFFEYRGVIVIREEGTDIANKFRFI